VTASVCVCVRVNVWRIDKLFTSSSPAAAAAACQLRRLRRLLPRCIDYHKRRRSSQNGLQQPAQANAACQRQVLMRGVCENNGNDCERVNMRDTDNERS